MFDPRFDGVILSQEWKEALAAINNLCDRVAFKLVCVLVYGHLVLLACEVTKQGVYKSRGYSQATCGRAVGIQCKRLSEVTTSAISGVAAKGTQVDGDGQAHEERAPTPARGLYAILHSIDSRLELIVRTLGYVSVLVVTPMFFVLTVVGIDIFSIIGIRELSESQKGALADLEVRGWEVDSSGALKALSAGDADFNKFLYVGVRPNADAAAEVVRKHIVSAMNPPFDTPEFKAYLNSSVQIKDTIAHLYREINATILEVESGELSDEFEYCAAMSAFLESRNYYFSLDKVSDCTSSVRTARFVEYVVSIESSIQEWTSLVDIESIDRSREGWDNRLANLLTESRLGVAAKLQSKNLSMDANGALKALKYGDKVFEDYLFLGIHPNPNDVSTVVSEFIVSASKPPFASTRFRSLIMENSQALAEIEKSVDSINSIIIKVKSLDSNVILDACFQIRDLLNSGEFSFEVSGVTDCEASIRKGVFISFLERLHSAVTAWSDLVESKRLEELTDLTKIEIQLSLMQAGEYSKFSRTDALENRLYRFSLMVTVLDRPETLQASESINVAVVNHDVDFSKSAKNPLFFLKVKNINPHDLEMCIFSTGVILGEYCHFDLLAMVNEDELMIIGYEPPTVVKVTDMGAWQNLNRKVDRLWFW